VKRTYGKIRELGRGGWIIEDLEPHVRLRLKTIFPRIPKTAHPPYILNGTVSLEADLLWFTERYPLEISGEDQAKLETRTQLFETQQNELVQLLSKDWKPSTVSGFRDGEAPYDYQAQAAELARRKGALLLMDDLGLGKTVSGIATFAGQPLLLPALIVPQTHLVTQWKEKIEEFTHHTVHVFNKATPYELPPADVYICPYSKIGGWCDFAGNAKADREFRTIIFDEVQELRRGTQSQKGAAAQAFCKSALVAMGLSATPIYNYGAEIFAIINLLSPGALGSWDDFTREYCHADPSGHWIVDDPQALGTFLRENALALRRTQAEVGHEIQPVNVISHEIDYDTKVLDEDVDLMRNLAIRVTTGEFTQRGQAAREFDMRMRKATGIAKAPHVAAFVKLLLDAGEPVVLFGWHRDVYDIWLTKLAKYNPILYTGSESSTQKDRAKKAFIQGRTNLLILSLRSGAGLDGLQQRGHIAVFGELDWSPKVHEQCVGRLQRPGQTKQVDAIYLTTNGGADPAIVGVLGLKASQSQGIVDPLQVPADQHSDGSRIKQLAEDYLAGKSREYVPSTVAEPDPETPDLFQEVA